VFAHPDDEAYGPAGTIAKLSKDNNVTILSLCRGNRPGSEEVSDSRQTSFKVSCALLGATPIILDYSDCHLEYNDTVKSIEAIIKDINPDVVYTHNISDIHKDHRLVAECCLVACRPTATSNIKEFYMCEMIASTDWSFGQLEPQFVPNVYVDVTEYFETKQRSMELYISELYEFPDARSIVSMKTLAMYRGKQVGMQVAESFKLVFSKS
jgi:LmbE family N-acetylglucosaminyl deacetylase